MKIYVTGATSNEKLFEVYKLIKDTFSKHGHEVKTPLETIEFCKTHNEKERFEKAMKDINEADFVISEISALHVDRALNLASYSQKDLEMLF